MNETANELIAKSSSQVTEMVKAFSACATKSTITDVVQHRMTVMTNLKKPNDKMCTQWPKCSFFGIFEGYDGVTCADFLKDHLVWLILSNRHFPDDPK